MPFLSLPLNPLSVLSSSIAGEWRPAAAPPSSPARLHQNTKKKIKIKINTNPRLFLLLNPNLNTKSSKSLPNDRIKDKRGIFLSFVRISLLLIPFFLFSFLLVSIISVCVCVCDGVRFWFGLEFVCGYWGYFDGSCVRFFEMLWVVDVIVVL
jgi:hypothetical protein